jgi:hypothetical protein
MQSDSIVKFCDEDKFEDTGRIPGIGIFEFPNFEISKLLSKDDEEHVSAFEEDNVDEDG